MKRSWLSWAVLSTLGIVTILLPDTDRRLFSLSEGHGPSVVDAIGVVLLLAGWAVLDIATWRRRHALDHRREVIVAMGAVGVAAAALLLWSVLGDRGAWWVLGATVLAAIQVLAAMKATFATAIPQPR
jgi:hypothetical protein